jgi:phenylpyruvate tautomerase PptA (4-oxalocrotonate tautomerase family)
MPLIEIDALPQPADVDLAHVDARRTPEETARVVETIAQVLARELSLAPDNVFVTVQPVESVERG